MPVPLGLFYLACSFFRYSGRKKEYGTSTLPGKIVRIETNDASAGKADMCGQFDSFSFYGGRGKEESNCLYFC